MKKLEELQAEHEQLGNQLTDTRNPDWSKWIDRRNNLSVAIAKMIEKISLSNRTSADTISLRQFNI